MPDVPEPLGEPTEQVARPERPERPTIAELREVTQPPAVRGRKNSEHWVADVYLRRISPYLTRALLPTGVSANTVTWFMIVTGASAGLSVVRHRRRVRHGADPALSAGWRNPERAVHPGTLNYPPA